MPYIDKNELLNGIYSDNPTDVMLYIARFPTADVPDTNVGDTISRQAAIDAIDALHDMPNAWLDYAVDAVMALPPVQSEGYAKLKQEFLRMASYIDVLLECSDEQKETLLGFISRLAVFMPWTERD